MENAYIIAWAIWLILAYFVYKNAQTRKLKSPMNWAFMAFLFGPIGLLVYYIQIVKPNKKVFRNLHLSHSL